MRTILIALGLLLVLAPAIPTVFGDPAVLAAGKASDEIVRKCSAGIFRRYGHRSQDGKWLLVRDKFMVMRIDACVANGGKVL